MQELLKCCLKYKQSSLGLQQELPIDNFPNPCWHVPLYFLLLSSSPLCSMDSLLVFDGLITIIIISIRGYVIYCYYCICIPNY